MLMRSFALTAAMSFSLAACGNGDDTSSPGDGGGTLKWYATCGDPVCRVPNDAGSTDSGANACMDGESEGQTCAAAGASCGDPEQNCGSVLLCTDHDPKVGGCPISSRRFKQDIAYVTPAELEDLKQSLLKVRLAKYRYKQGDGARHLGFIIEDSPDIPASDVSHARVDLYAYASMAVAALQVQAREIEQLQADIDSLTNEIEGLPGRRHVSALTCPVSTRRLSSTSE
jgi:hypothetical protein